MPGRTSGLLLVVTTGAVLAVLAALAIAIVSPAADLRPAPAPSAPTAADGSLVTSRPEP